MFELVNLVPVLFFTFSFDEMLHVAYLAVDVIFHWALFVLIFKRTLFYLAAAFPSIADNIAEFWI